MIAEEGVVYGYVPLGSFRDRTIVYIGRSTSKAAREAVVEQRKKILCRTMSGLNKPEKVLFWMRVPNVSAAWEKVVDYMYGRMYDSAVRRVHVLGDNWYEMSADKVDDHVDAVHVIVFGEC